METITIYVAKDGVRFDTSEECLAYEKVLTHVDSIFSKLLPRELGRNKAIQQDVKKVEEVRAEFFLYCAEVIPEHKDTFIETAAYSGLTMGLASRILSDYSYQYPVLNKASYRLDCINMTSGIEYEQPYYALHKEEFKGIVK